MRLGTPEGVGVAFIDDRAASFGGGDAPYALMVMRHGATRDRAVRRVLEEGCQIVVAENLVAASASFFQHPISLVLVDATVHGGHWATAGEALGLDTRRIPVLLIDESGSSGGRELPPWARITGASGLDGSAVREMLEARPKAA